VRIVARGALPRTTSGKVRRAAVADAYWRGDLPSIDVHHQGDAVLMP
jgi:acyl-coenzyme A synthetase/AMP-(fatty) acid ligase